MIIQQKLKRIGNQITNQELFLDYKETYLMLQRALLNLNMIDESEAVGKIYEKTKTKFLEGDEEKQSKESQVNPPQNRAEGD